jgi:two-component system, NtrC family, nitrogen regulation sensor histidine kinase NtrY
MASSHASTSAALRYGRSFTFSLVWRLATVLILGAVLMWAIIWTDSGTNMVATTVLITLLIALLLWDILNLIQRTNREVARVLSAMQYGDYSQAFLATPPDAGFPELAAALENLLARQRDKMTALNADNSHLLSLIEHVPIPLLTIDGEDNVALLNNAARRLFNRSHGRHMADFAIYGARFIEELRQHSASGLITINPNDDAEIKVRRTEATITRLGLPLRLIALQPIQADLDATEMALSRDLVRVLTHEMMNSLTPVISLAKSASALTRTLPATADNNDATVEIQRAIDTVERRTEGLMQFVERYREITGVPHIAAAPFTAIHLLSYLETLFYAEWPREKIALVTEVTPIDWQINADRELLEQALINLIRNAAQASSEHAAEPAVRLTIRMAHGGGTLIDVEDNGAGIAEHLRRDVFLPFFTTKPTGSGIGLALARQIVIAHGGSIRVETSALGGACIRIVL